MTDPNEQSRTPWPQEIEIGKNPRVGQRDWAIRVSHVTQNLLDNVALMINDQGVTVSLADTNEIIVSIRTIYDKPISALDDMVRIANCLRSVDELLTIREINNSPRENWETFLGRDRRSH